MKPQRTQSNQRKSFKKMSRKRDSIQSNESASDYVNKHRQSDDPHLHLNRRITENNFDADQNPSRLDNVRVVCRFRPPSAREIRYSQKHCIPDDPPVIEGCQVITINRPPSKETSRPNRKARKSKFFRTCLDDVFAPDATQKEIFKLVGQPTILSCLEGFNNTVFAYGQSGSGWKRCGEHPKLQISPYILSLSLSDEL